MKMLLEFQIVLIQEKHGQIVNLSEKLEIKLTVDHVGLLELLQQWVTEFALPQTKPYKLEFQLKIYLLAVMDSFQDVVMVAMVDSHQELGNTGSIMVLLLEI